MEDMTAALTRRLESIKVTAVACPKGQVKGNKGDVRLFEIEHIKGLEFETVFLVGIDGLLESEPDLFDQYLYVGATRAATFLGLTCATDALPGRLEPLATQFQRSW